MKIVMYTICILCCIVSGGIMYFTLTASSGAPQEAAGAAMACAFVIIPYVLARAFEKILSKD